MKDKIQYFPITAFSVIMGLSGLTIAFGKFYHLQWLPKLFYDISIFTVLILFVITTLAYGLKWVFFKKEVHIDFTHKIRINFFSGISISLILLSIAFYTYYPIFEIPVWWIGTALYTVFLFITIKFWIQHNIEIKFFNPAWFIPVVGNILVPIGGADFAPLIISYFYFTVGFFFWIVLFTIFLNRVIFHDQLPEKFIPTFFIILAPPALGFISYIRLTASWDSFSIFLLFMTYFFVILLVAMYTSFSRLKYYMSWWAFTFPLAAATIASTVAFQITQYSFFKYAAWILLLSAITAIIIVARQTIIHIKKGEICIQEE